LIIGAAARRKKWLGNSLPIFWFITLISGNRPMVPIEKRLIGVDR
jgi:hypothetical protein